MRVQRGLVDAIDLYLRQASGRAVRTLPLETGSAGDILPHDSDRSPRGAVHSTLVGPNTATVGTPRAAETCTGPLSFPIVIARAPQNREELFQGKRPREIPRSRADAFREGAGPFPLLVRSR